MHANEPRRYVSKVTSLLFGAVFCGATPMFAHAQTGASTRPVAVIVSGGASVPTGGFKDYNDLGVHADASLLVRLGGQAIRLRPELSYARFGVKKVALALPVSNWAGQTMVNRAVSPTSAGRATATGVLGAAATLPPAPTPTTDGASTLLGLLGNIEVPLAGGLYVIGGVGATNVKSGATNAASDASQTALTYNGGAGLRFRIGSISGFVEGRLKSLSLDKGKALFSDVTTIPVSFGLVF